MRIRLSVLSFLLWIAAAAAAQDWPHWRGPGRDGVGDASLLPANGVSKLTLRWRTPVGAGYSSPVVSGGKAFVFAREAGNELLARVDLASGKVDWKQNYAAPVQVNQYATAHGKGPYSTPAVQGDRVFTLGLTNILTCWNAQTGAVLWRKDYSKGLDTTNKFVGAAMSPLIHAGRVVVFVGDDRGGQLLALDAATGNQIWATKGDGPSYASPLLASFDGVAQIVTLSDRSVLGVEAATGKLLWKHPFTDEWNENIVSPLAHRGRILIGGVRRPLAALDVKRGAGGWTVREAWRNAEIALYMANPVIDGDLLYGLGSKRKGQFFCLDLNTGAVRWITNGREGDNAAILAAGGYLLMLTPEGEFVAAKKSASGFQPLLRQRVADGAAWAAPALLKNQLLIKEGDFLSLWTIG